MNPLLIRTKTIEVLGKSYSPKILAYFLKNNIVAVTGKQYTGVYIRSIVGGFQKNLILEAEIMKFVLIENKKKQALNKRFANI
jgi:hypothetical protein